MPKEIPKSQQGKEACKAIGENTEVCVRGRRYGYDAKIVTTDGRHQIPLSIGKANSVKKALEIAVRKARRISLFGADRRENRRGPRPRNPDGTLAGRRRR